MKLCRDQAIERRRITFVLSFFAIRPLLLAEVGLS